MKVQFKDIRIKHFDDDLPLSKSYPILAKAYSVKPQGKLPADWQPKVYDVR